MAEDRLPTPAMIMSTQHYENQLLAKEVEERAKDPLDEAKRAGGFFLRADGTPVDSENREIKDADLTADEKKAVAEVRKGGKDAESSKAAADKEAAKASADAAKADEEARKSRDQAEADRVAADRAKAAAAAKKR